MGRRRWSLATRTILGLGVLVIALSQLGDAARHADFHMDESHHIWMARFFHHFFVRHDLAHPEWADGHWAHTQPKVGPYVIGAALWSHGYDLEQVPLFFDWEKSVEENRALGRMPDDEMLARARAPMVLLAAGSVVLLYLLGLALGGVLAGLVAAALALGSGPARLELVQALLEAPLMFFVLLALLIGLVGARRSPVGGLRIGWAVALGVALGLALGAKLTAMLSLAAVLAWGGLLAVLATWRPNVSEHAPATTTWAGRGGAAWAAGRGWALAVVVAVGVFVLSDPHLYSDPPLHTAHLFQNRLREMASQQRVFAQEVLHDPRDRASYLLEQSLVRRTLTGLRGLPPIEVGLAALGVATLLVGAWLGWRRTGRLPAEGLVLLTVLAYFAGIGAGLGLAWPRYVVPTVLVGTLLGGLGAAAILRPIGSLSRSLPRFAPAQGNARAT